MRRTARNKSSSLRSGRYSFSELIIGERSTTSVLPDRIPSDHVTLTTKCFTVSIAAIFGVGMYRVRLVIAFIVLIPFLQEVSFVSFSPRQNFNQVRAWCPTFP